MKKKNSTAKIKTKNTEIATDTESPKKRKLKSRQRKALLKIIEKKEKNLKRKDMLSELKSHELTTSTLSLMTSISQTQTRGLRNVLKDKKKCQKTKPEANNCSLDEMTVDNEDTGSELEDIKIA